MMQAALATDTAPPAPRPGRGAVPDADRDAASWTLLDDPQEWAAFGRPLGAAEAPACWESHVAVEGIHCAACAMTIEDALGAVPGVQAVRVNAASRRARIVWSPAEARPSQWFAAAAQAGYRFVPAGDVSRQQARRIESRRALFRWLVSGLCMMQVMMYAVPAYVAGPGDMTRDIELLLRWASWVLTLPVMLFACGPFFSGAWRDLTRPPGPAVGRPAPRGGARRLGAALRLLGQRRISMDLPVSLGILITFFVSTAGTFDPDGPLGREVFFDSLTMFVFFLLTGRWLEARLRDRTAGALDALMGRLPDSVERRGPDGGFAPVAAHRLAPGDVIRVRPGEAFAADGVVIEGDTSADEALLTGESTPVPRPCGARVLAGSHNLGAAVLVQVGAVGQATRFGQIVALMEDAATQKPRLAQLADRVARPFLVAVLAAAALAAVWWWPAGPGHALMVAASVLIVTCPCALSLATPAAMLASAGERARQGVLVARLQALESLAAVDTVVFDKTGTLTRRQPRLARIYSRRGVPPGDALALAAALAEATLHPAAQALADAWRAQGAVSNWVLAEAQEHAGQGVQGRLRPRRPGGAARALRLGSAAFCGVPRLDVPAMQVHLSGDDGWVASFVLEEDLRADAAEAVAALGGEGVQVQLLSGDRDAAARRLAAGAGIALARGGCLPEDKLDAVRRMQAAGRRVAMVGDGLNDGPVIAQADASFAFGHAVALTSARADFIVLGDALSAIPATLSQARRTLRVVRQNLAWSAAYNAVSVPLALAGWMPAWLAGLGMAASSLLVVLNSARLAK